jgi:hypothetical protein
VAGSDYGHFFLDWYAQSLCDHGERMLRVGREVFGAGHEWRRGDKLTSLSMKVQRAPLCLGRACG